MTIAHLIGVAATALMGPPTPPLSPPFGPPVLPPSQPPSQPPSSPPLGLLANGVTVDVKGKSGKMTISNGKQNITVEMDSVSELDANGNLVGQTGPPNGKHSLNNFASVDFTIDPMELRTDYGVPAEAVDFSTSLINGQADLLVSTCIFMHNGRITPTANESWPVTGGTVKFSFQIDQWPFCAGESEMPCDGDVGEYVELTMVIKADSGEAANQTGGGNDFTLATNEAGEGITLELSNEVKIDGVWTKMPDGYPKMTEQGSKQLFIFRLPKFSSSAFYDPIIDGLQLAASLSPPLPPPPSMPLPGPSC